MVDAGQHLGEHRCRLGQSVRSQQRGWQRHRNLYGPHTGRSVRRSSLGRQLGNARQDGGLNQFYVNNDRGDEGLAYGGGGPRGAATPVSVVQRPSGGSWTAPTTIATGTY